MAKREKRPREELPPEVEDCLRSLGRLFGEPDPMGKTPPEVRAVLRALERLVLAHLDRDPERLALLERLEATHAEAVRLRDHFLALANAEAKLAQEHDGAPAPKVCA